MTWYSGSCSCANCAYSNHSNRPSVQHLVSDGTRIDKLFYGKYIPLRERKVLEKLVRTRAVYDDIRNRLLSTSGTSAQTKSSTSKKMVEFSDRGEVRSSNTSRLSSCCTCCSCSSLKKIKKHINRHPRVHKHYIPYENIAKYKLNAEKRAKARRKRLGTKISGKMRDIRFNAKNIHSDPCFCTLSLIKFPSILSEKKGRSKDITMVSRPPKSFTDLDLKAISKPRQKLISITQSIAKTMETRFKIKKDSLSLFRAKLRKKRARRRKHGSDSYPPEGGRRKNKKKIHHKISGTHVETISTSSTFASIIKASTMQTKMEPSKKTRQKSKRGKILSQESQASFLGEVISKPSQYQRRKAVAISRTTNSPLKTKSELTQMSIRPKKFHNYSKHDLTKSGSSKSIKKNQTGHSIKKCFCTFKLQQKKRILKRATSKQITAISNLHSDKSGRVQKTQTKSINEGHDYMLPIELSPYECEPYNCLPGKCDPYDCAKKINVRYQREIKRNRKITSENHNSQKSISTITFQGKTNIHQEKTQSIKKNRKYTHARGIKAHKPRISNTKLQVNTINKTKPTNKEAFWQKCICTLKLFNKDSSKKNTGTMTPPDNKNKVKVKVQNKTNKNDIYTHDPLLPYECEPGICVPNKCDPYKCENFINLRNMQHRNKYPDTNLTTSSSYSEVPHQLITSKAQSQSFTIEKKTKKADKSSKEHQFLDSAPSNRKAVRIGSNFSFNIEFFKEQIEANNSKEIDITPKVNKKKIHDIPSKKQENIKRRQVTKKTRGSQPISRDSKQIGIPAESGAKKRTNYIGSAMKTCLCSLKLHKKGRNANIKEKHLLANKETKTLQFNETRSNTWEIKSTNTNRSHTLHSYECSPGSCVPDMCDPHKCYEIIKRRKNKQYRDRHAMTEKRKGKSVISMTSSELSSGFKSRSTQSSTIEHPLLERKSKQENTQNIYTPSRQAVRIGSSFSFSVNFYKDDSISNIRDKTITTMYNTVSKLTITDKRKHMFSNYNRHTPRNHLLETKNTVQTNDNVSNVGNVLKKCFCTLAFQKKEFITNKNEHDFRSVRPIIAQFAKIIPRQIYKKGEGELKTLNPSNKPIETSDNFVLRHNLHCAHKKMESMIPIRQKNEMEANYYNIDFEKQNKNNSFYRSYYALNLKVSQIRKRNQIAVLEDDECEPDICVPYQCEPTECLERIKSRFKSWKQTETDPIGSRAIASMTARKRLSHSYSQADKYSVHKDFRPSQRKKRFGSSVKFNVAAFTRYDDSNNPQVGQPPIPNVHNPNVYRGSDWFPIQTQEPYFDDTATRHRRTFLTYYPEKEDFLRVKKEPKKTKFKPHGEQKYYRKRNINDLKLSNTQTEPVLLHKSTGKNRRANNMQTVQLSTVTKSTYSGKEGKSGNVSLEPQLTKNGKSTKSSVTYEEFDTSSKKAESNKKNSKSIFSRKTIVSSVSESEKPLKSLTRGKYRKSEPETKTPTESETKSILSRKYAPYGGKYRKLMSIRTDRASRIARSRPSKMPKELEKFLMKPPRRRVYTIGSSINFSMQFFKDDDTLALDEKRGSADTRSSIAQKLRCFCTRSLGRATQDVRSKDEKSQKEDISSKRKPEVLSKTTISTRESLKKTGKSEYETSETTAESKYEGSEIIEESEYEDSGNTEESKAGMLKKSGKSKYVVSTKSEDDYENAKSELDESGKSIKNKYEAALKCFKFKKEGLGKGVKGKIEDLSKISVCKNAVLVKSHEDIYKVLNRPDQIEHEPSKKICKNKCKVSIKSEFPIKSHQITFEPSEKTINEYKFSTNSEKDKHNVSMIPEQLEHEFLNKTFKKKLLTETVKSEHNVSKTREKSNSCPCCQGKKKTDNEVATRKKFGIKSLCKCKMPVCTCKMPECTCKMPECTCKMPECTCKMPKCTCKMPKCTCKMPVCKCRKPVCTCKMPDCMCKKTECNCNKKKDNQDAEVMPDSLSNKSDVSSYDKSTLTKGKRFSKSLYECEPNVCVPDICDPNMCFKIFKSRRRYKNISISATKEMKTKSVGTPLILSASVSGAKRCFCILKLKNRQTKSIHKKLDYAIRDKKFPCVPCDERLEKKFYYKNLLADKKAKNEDVLRKSLKNAAERFKKPKESAVSPKLDQCCRRQRKWTPDMEIIMPYSEIHAAQMEPSNYSRHVLKVRNACPCHNYKYIKSEQPAEYQTEFESIGKSPYISACQKCILALNIRDKQKLKRRKFLMHDTSDYDQTEFERVKKRPHMPAFRKRKLALNLRGKRKPKAPKSLMSAASDYDTIMQKNYQKETRPLQPKVYYGKRGKTKRPMNGKATMLPVESEPILPKPSQVAIKYDRKLKSETYKKFPVYECKCKSTRFKHSSICKCQLQDFVGPISSELETQKIDASKERRSIFQRISQSLKSKSLDMAYNLIKKRKSSIIKEQIPTDSHILTPKSLIKPKRKQRVRKSKPPNKRTQRSQNVQTFHGAPESSKPGKMKRKHQQLLLKTADSTPLDAEISGFHINNNITKADKISTGLSLTRIKKYKLKKVKEREFEPSDLNYKTHVNKKKKRKLKNTEKNISTEPETISPKLDIAEGKVRKSLIEIVRKIPLKVTQSLKSKSLALSLKIKSQSDKTKTKQKTTKKPIGQQPKHRSKRRRGSKKLEHGMGMKTQLHEPVLPGEKKPILKLKHPYMGIETKPKVSKKRMLAKTEKYISSKPETPKSDVTKQLKEKGRKLLMETIQKIPLKVLETKTKQKTTKDLNGQQSKDIEGTKMEVKENKLDLVDTEAVTSDSEKSIEKHKKKKSGDAIKPEGLFEWAKKNILSMKVINKQNNICECSPKLVARLPPGLEHLCPLCLKQNLSETCTCGHKGAVKVNDKVVMPGICPVCGTKNLDAMIPQIDTKQPVPNNPLPASKKSLYPLKSLKKNDLSLLQKPLPPPSQPIPPLFSMVVDAKSLKVRNKEEIYRKLGVGCEEKLEGRFITHPKQGEPLVDFVINRDTANILRPDDVVRTFGVNYYNNYKKTEKGGASPPLECPWCNPLQNQNITSAEGHGDHCSCCICQKDKEGTSKNGHPKNCTCCICRYGCQFGAKSRHPPYLDPRLDTSVTPPVSIIKEDIIKKTSRLIKQKYAKVKEPKGGKGEDKKPTGKSSTKTEIKTKKGTEKGQGKGKVKDKTKVKGKLIAKKKGKRKKKGKPRSIRSYPLNALKSIQNYRKTCYCGIRTCPKRKRKFHDKFMKILGADISLDKPDPCTCGSKICKEKYKRKTPYYRELRKKKILKEKKKLKQRMIENEEGIARVKLYEKEDAAKRRRIKAQDRRAMAEVIKYKDRANGFVLLAENMADIGRFSINQIRRLMTGFGRAFRHPTDCRVRAMLARRNPSATARVAMEEFQSSGFSGTAARISQRCTSIQASKYMTGRLEANPITNYLLHFRSKDPEERLLKKAPDPEPDFNCNLFLTSLRKRPCLWIYNVCPWFYPHCLSLLAFWRQFTDIILFILAVGVWSPCILLTELCRTIMCCFMCAGGGG